MASEKNKRLPAFTVRGAPPPRSAPLAVPRAPTAEEQEGAAPAEETASTLTPSAERFEELGGFYGKVFYTNVMAGASLFFEPGISVLDLGCGPGLVAEKLALKGYQVTLMDYNAEYLAAAMDRVPGALARRGNILYDPMPQADAVLCVNTLGYFDQEQQAAILRRLPGRKLLANFFMGEDQGDSQYLAGVEGDVWTYQLGELVLPLYSTRENVLARALSAAGYTMVTQFIYNDFKVERLVFAERK